MGGLGSGNSDPRWNTKATVDGCLVLDVNEWRRRGALKPGAFLTCYWSQGERETGSIGARCVSEDGGAHVTAITLIYRASRGENAEDIRETVPIVWTACRYGGERPWFLCPGAGCGRRVRRLYGGRDYRFLCRRCLNFGYFSQRQRAPDRALARMRAIRQRLGGTTGRLDPFPWKPPRMHWRTYERLRREYDAAERVRDAYLEAWLAGANRFLAGRQAQLARSQWRHARAVPGR